MQRILNTGLVLASLLLPLGLRAQYGPAKGTCLLRDGQQLAGTTRIVAATAQAPSTFIYYEKNQPQELTPDEVRTCQVGKHQFIVSGGFVAPDDRGGLPVDRDFIEIIDTTGGVQVFAYTYERFIAAKNMRGTVVAMPSGNMMSTAGQDTYHSFTLYLMRARGSRAFMPYAVKITPGFLTNKKELDNQADAVTLQKLFPEDPVLQQELLAGKIGNKQLPEVVLAYNQGVRRKVR